MISKEELEAVEREEERCGREHLKSITRSIEEFCEAYEDTDSTFVEISVGLAIILLWAAGACAVYEIISYLW
jgi:hypothetical protein